MLKLKFNLNLVGNLFLLNTQLHPQLTFKDNKPVDSHNLKDKFKHNTEFQEALKLVPTVLNTAANILQINQPEFKVLVLNTLLVNTHKVPAVVNKHGLKVLVNKANRKKRKNKLVLQKDFSIPSITLFLLLLVEKERISKHITVKIKTCMKNNLQEKLPDLQVLQVRIMPLLNT